MPHPHPLPAARPQRNSSLELLRILLMLLILLLHANYTAIGYPPREELLSSPLLGYLQLTAEALCVVAVNVFLLISGYFGIRLRGQGLLGLIFQSSFYGVIAFFLLWAITPGMGFSPGYLLKLSLPLTSEGGWFLPVYVGLMLLSPLLNRALEQLSTRELGRYLLLYYGLHTVWVFGFKSMDGMDGYSVFSFIGIYLLGAFLRRTQARWQAIPGWKFLLSYVGISLASALLYLVISLLTGLSLQRGLLPWAFISYASPLVIAAAVSLFLYFARQQFYIPLINAIGGSTLGVYLIHAHGHVFPHYLDVVRQLHEQPLPTFLTYLLIFVLLVFVGSILVDQIRLLLWKKIILPLYQRLEPRLLKYLA